MSLRIVIDAYQDSHAVTGTDRMAANFLRELQTLDTTNQYEIICSNEAYVRNMIHAQNFTVCKPPIAFKQRLIKRVFNYAWRRTNLIRYTLRKPDTYYSFHNLRLPAKRVAKHMIATNLDLIPIVLDEYKGRGRISFKQQLERFKKVAESADHIISISEFSKNELIENLSVDKSKVSVVYLAADAMFTQSTDAVLPGGLNSQQYLFTIGGSEPRKNVTTVVAAHRRLPQTLRENFPLVIGGGNWKGQTLDTNNDPTIIQLGYVAENALPSLYAHAAAFIFASEYEGFGFALLEAMSCATPVLNASGSSLDEVAGDATLTFGAHNIDQLTMHLQKLLNSPDLVKALAEKGSVQNNRFSWQKSAIALHALLTGSDFSD